MIYLQKLKDNNINPAMFAKTLGKTRDWGYKLYSGKFALRSCYFEAVRANYKFINKTDLV